jgi:hypothetical protein
VALHALTDASSAPALRTRARFVLQQLHDAETVSALLDVVSKAPPPPVQREVLLTLARLYNTEAPWTGDWWGTHPSTQGPYFAPATWEQSARIQPALRQALLAATGDDANQLIDAYVANRVLPGGARAVLAATASPNDPQHAALIDALVGTSQLAPTVVPLLAQLDARGPAFHTAVAELLAGEASFGPQTLALARAAVLDATLDGTVRGKLLNAFSQMPGDAGRDAATAIFAQLTPRVSAPTGAAPTLAGAPAAGAPGAPGAPGAGSASSDPIEAAWRRWVGDRQRFAQIDYFVDLAKSSADPAQRTLAYAVLVQSVRTPRTPQAIRDKVTPVLQAAWSDANAAPRLVDAITLMRLESQYAEQLQAYRAGGKK